jgi:hypothetical protein
VGDGDGFIFGGGFWKVDDKRREEKGSRLDFWALTEIQKDPLRNVL